MSRLYSKFKPGVVADVLASDDLGTVVAWVSGEPEINDNQPFLTTINLDEWGSEELIPMPEGITKVYLVVQHGAVNDVFVVSACDTLKQVYNTPQAIGFIEVPMPTSMHPI